jgi:uracil phosphoribosyltransferase
MNIHNISEENSVLNHFLSQIREVTIQKDSMRFRRNMERIGEIMAYEISKKLSYKTISITTPLGIKNTSEIEDKNSYGRSSNFFRGLSKPRTIRFYNFCISVF